VTFTMYHAMATNPIPDKSSQLYAVTLDTWSAERPYDDDTPENPPQLLTYRDATYLHAANAAKRSVVMYKSGALLVPERKGVKPYNAMLRVTSHEFFPMFDVPFEYGQGWDAAADQGPAPVVVIGHETNEKVRSQQRRVRGSGGRVHPVRLGQVARAARVRQHQLLEARSRQQLPGLPEFRVHLAAVLGRAADGGGS
jgi:putative ABC transport system permease protein